MNEEITWKMKSEGWSERAQEIVLKSAMMKVVVENTQNTQHGNERDKCADCRVSEERL